MLGVYRFTQQRITTKVNFTSVSRGEGRFPSGENLGSGIMTKYPSGIIDAPPAKVH